MRDERQCLIWGRPPIGRLSCGLDTTARTAPTAHAPPFAFMSGLRQAVLLLSPTGGDEERPAAAVVRRGRYQALSPRETEFLLAAFAINPLPPLPDVEQLAALAVLTPQRIRKFFDNQRVARVKEAAAQLQQLTPQPAPASAASGSAGTGTSRKRKAVAPPSNSSSGSDSSSSSKKHNSSSGCSSAGSISASGWSDQLLGAPSSFSFSDASGLRSDPGGAPSFHDAVAAVAAAAVAATAAGAAEAAAEPDALGGAIDQKLSDLLVPENPLCMTAAASAASAGPLRCSPQTRLQCFADWLQGQRVDPFSCARRCSDIYQLASLLELHGRSSGLVSFFFAGACVLRVSFALCKLEPPTDSLASWQALLSDPAATAILSRASDSLWYHVRRVGARFPESIPAKARDDTLTALSIIAAIAPHSRFSHDLVLHQAHADSHSKHERMLISSCCACVLCSGRVPSRPGVCPPAPSLGCWMWRRCSRSRRSSLATACRCWRRCSVWACSTV